MGSVARSEDAAPVVHEATLAVREAFSAPPGRERTTFRGTGKRLGGQRIGRASSPFRSGANPARRRGSRRPGIPRRPVGTAGE
jgi:hypothetical protein